jgi:hypothetical protein
MKMIAVRKKKKGGMRGLIRDATLIFETTRAN